MNKKLKELHKAYSEVNKSIKNLEKRDDYFGKLMSEGKLVERIDAPLLVIEEDAVRTYAGCLYARRRIIFDEIMKEERNVYKN